MKRFRVQPVCLLFLALALISGPLLAQQLDEKVPNWAVPSAAHGSKGGMTTQADIGLGGAAFIPVDPCRIVNTRNAGFPAGFGPPSLTAGVSRNFALLSGPCTGLPPTGVSAYSLNITVTNTQGAGFIKVYPQGAPVVPPVSTLNYNGVLPPGLAIANAAVVPAGTGGGITVVAGVSGTDLLIDINGYFIGNGSLTPLNPNEFVGWQGDAAFQGIVYGKNTNSNGFGVQGVASYIGVYGSSNNAGGVGVRGDDLSSPGSGTGVLGFSAPGVGVWGETNNQIGVFGFSSTPTNVATFGVWGETFNVTAHSAGVQGTTVGGLVNTFGEALGVFGNDGTATGHGVLGISQNRGVEGARTDANGVIQTNGVLGYSGTSGVHSFQDVTAGGTKPFVVPYPGKPDKQIVFVSTEADEVLTATRGRIKLQGSLGVIQLPTHFLKVTEPEGWTVQLTPVGDLSTLAVVKMDADKGEIVIKGSRAGVDVFWRVEGIRRGYRNFQPVQDNVYFVPASANSAMDPWPAETSRILIENKIYNEDGKPNLETAKAVGWTKVWEENEAATKKAIAKAAADRESADGAQRRPTVQPPQ